MKTKLILSMLVMFVLTSCYDFNREQKQKDAESNGIAILLEAESSKKAQIEEAKAQEESAKLLGQAKITESKAQAESMIILAESKAKSIEIVSKAIEGKNDYLRFKTIEAMYEKGKFIYIPTEAGVPILEAGNNK